MCTAVHFLSENAYFGRNLDIEYSMGEQIVIAPQNFQFRFKSKNIPIIGVAYISDGYPLYYDGINTFGLAAAGLAFRGNAEYKKYDTAKVNIPSYDFISYILACCKDVSNVKSILKDVNITDEAFSDKLHPTPLHWMISDKNNSICVESTKKGLFYYDNPVGVLTNNPEFEFQMFNLNNYLKMTNLEPENTFIQDLNIYSNGMGAMGLPGDLSSQSRFVKAVFTKHFSHKYKTEEENVEQFFHILQSVEQQQGCVRNKDKYEYTRYSSCCNLTKGIYYYKTYFNSKIRAVDINRENLFSTNLIVYPIKENSQIMFLN